MEQKLIRDTFMKFFITSLASSLILSVLSMTDLIIAGYAVGEAGLAAVSLALPVTILVQIAAALWGTGGAIAFSAKLGENNLEACSRIFTLALAGALASGFVLGAAGLWKLEGLVRFLGAVNEGEIRLAGSYVGILLAGFPFLILSPVMITFLRNDSRQKYAMLCVVTGAVLNVVCSLLFSLVFGWGIAGVGMATVLSQGICCFMAGIKLFRSHLSYGLTKTFFSVELIKEMLAPGSTVALIFLCQVFLTIVINRILNNEGGAAVYAVIKYLINFQFALFDGVTGAVQPMFGIYYGEGESENIRRTSACAFAAMMGMAAIMFLVFELGGDFLWILFSIESVQIAEMTAAAAHILGIYCFGAAAVTFLNAFYRCVGKEQISFWLGLADNLIFPMAAILFLVYILDMGVMGVFLGLCVSVFLTLLLWMLLVRPWKNGILLLKKNQFPAAEGEYHRIIPATFQEAERILAEVEEYCEQMEISMKKQYYINLSIEELIVNVIGLADEGERGKKDGRNFYADIRIRPMDSGMVYLRIRDNLTEWRPAEEKGASLLELDESVKVNELGIGIIKRIAVSYSYRRTIGFNNFSVIL